MDDDRARELLAAERQRIEHALGRLTHADNTEPADEFDPANLASDLYQDELDEGLAGDLREQLAAVERAEQRVAAGTYGLSVESGERIPDERLEAFPTAELTADERSGPARTPERGPFPTELRGPAGRCSGSAGTRSSGRTRSSARRGGRTSRSPYDDRAASGSPRKLTYARPVDASDAAAITSRAHSMCASACAGSCQPVTALSTNGIDRSANAVSPSPTRRDRAAHLVHVDLALRPRRVAVELARAGRSARRRGAARFVALKYEWMPFGQSGSISVWITVVRHRAEQVGDRLGDRRGTRATCASPSSTGPAETAMSAATFLPCHSSGITGSGGAVVRLTSAVTSSDAPGAQSRNARRRSRVGVGRVEDRPGVDDRADRVQLELELRDDAEVAAAAAQPPEQVGVLASRSRARAGRRR